MLTINLQGKRALVAGVADDGGFGFAIAKALAEAGASVCLGIWPPAFGIFNTLLLRGKFHRAQMLEDGRLFSFERIYPLDVDFDVAADIPPSTRENKRYRDHGDVSIDGLGTRLKTDFGPTCLDILVHCLANGPEVKKPLLATSRQCYLAAVGTSAYSLTSLIQHLAPLMRPAGSALALSYLAALRVVPGYGGGMASAKAALENDVRTLAYEAGRKHGLRINAISAGPFPSRAASAIGPIAQTIAYYRANSPLPEAITATEVAHCAAFLLSPLASGITGTTVYVDKGYHAMGVAPSILSQTPEVTP